MLKAAVDLQLWLTRASLVWRGGSLVPALIRQGGLWKKARRTVPTTSVAWKEWKKRLLDGVEP